MKVTTITVKRGTTVNLGDYESERLDVSLSAELEEGEDPDQVKAGIKAWLDSDIEGFKKEWK